MNKRQCKQSARAVLVSVVVSAGPAPLLFFTPLVLFADLLDKTVQKVHHDLLPLDLERHL